MKPKRIGAGEWFGLSFFIFIMASVLFWFIVSAAKIPHARSLARAYEASSDCSSSKLLPTAAGQSPLQNSSPAPATTLCVVRSMTLVRKEYRTARSSHSYEVLLDDAGTRYDVTVDDDSAKAWRTLHAKMKVNVQMVQGNVTLIANGTGIARTQDQPEIHLHDLYTQFVIFGLFSVPAVAVLVVLARYLKRPRG